MKSLHSFLETARKESENIAEDIGDVRQKIKSSEEFLASSVMRIMSFLKNYWEKSKKIKIKK